MFFTQSRTQSRFLLFTLLWFLPACFGRQQEEPFSRVVIVADNGHVAPDVLKLLELTGIDHDGTLPDIVEKTQVHWIRKPGTERWDIQDQPVPNADQIHQLLSKLGLNATIKPVAQSYEYALLLGALFSTMVIRMQHLVDLWNKGVRFNRVVLLGGARPANQQQGESKEAVERFAKKLIDQAPQTETDLLKLAYEYTSMPEAMRAIPVQIIDVPMLPKGDGTMRRPTTGDTVEYWLKTDPTPGRVLAISNQPYVNYQESVLRTLLPVEYPVDAVGAASSEDTKLGVLLDTLARILYQEKLRLKL